MRAALILPHSEGSPIYAIATATGNLIFGTSLETKPDQVPVGSSFFDLDNGNLSQFNGSVWLPVNNHRNVRSLADFPAPVAGVITLADFTAYQINGLVDIGTNRIVCGIKNTVVGTDRQNDILVSSTPGNMFTMDSGVVPKLSLIFDNLTLRATAGAVFSVSGGVNPAQLTLITTTISQSVSGGTMSNVALSIRTSSLSSAFSTNGFLFTGANSAITFRDSTAMNNAGTLFDITGTTFSVIRIGRNFISVSPGQPFLNAAGAVLTTAGQMALNIITGAGTFITGFTADTAPWNFSNNAGIVNTSLTLARGESLAESANSTATFAVKLTVPFTPTLAQDFLVEWYAEFAQSNNNKGVEIRAQVDGANVGANLNTALNNNDYQSVSGFALLPLTATSHTFTLDFRQNGGGTAKIKNARLKITRG